ncbi:MAG: metalloregulator ArsR/SmtB family transcription factor [Betaproteobacteria bacterium]
MTARSTASENRSAAIDRALSALSDPTRRAVVDLLRMQPRRAGELADALDMSAPALSRHLRVLRQSGVIADDAVEEDARVKLYRLQPEIFTTLRDWLDEVESFWGEQLQSFKAHAERKSTSRRK